MEKDMFAQPIPKEWYTQDANTCFARSSDGEGSYYCPNCGSNAGSVWMGESVPKKVNALCWKCEDLFYRDEEIEFELKLGSY